jgi:hypothetical protein
LAERGCAGDGDDRADRIDASDRFVSGTNRRAVTIPDAGVAGVDGIRGV